MDVALKPSFAQRLLLSKPEKCFYKVLRETFSMYTILAKVRLADLIEANVHPRWQTNFSRIRSKRVDFVICDASFSPLVAVELDGPSAKSVDQPEGDNLVDRILKEASLQVVHVPRQERYFHNELRQLLLPKLSSSQLS